MSLKIGGGTLEIFWPSHFNVNRVPFIHHNRMFDEPSRKPSQWSHPGRGVGHICLRGLAVKVGSELDAYESHCQRAWKKSWRNPKPTVVCEDKFVGKVRVVAIDDIHDARVEPLGNLILNPKLWVQ